MSNGITVRQSVEGLAGSAQALSALQDAYGKMQNITDNRGWSYWAGLHGVPQWLCWHHGRVGMGTQRRYNLFLPWHRAYLLYFEHAARDQNTDAAVPWWNWTSDMSHADGVPRPFASPRVNGARNPLFSGPVPETNLGPARQSVRFPGDPASLPTPAAVESVLNLTSFVDFQIQLEDIHDLLHGWTGGINPRSDRQPRGGDMGAVATAAYDPIFWSHHAMIDRVWYLWQLRHGTNNIPPDYLARPLAPFSLTVQDVLDIRRLGYEYAQTIVRT